SDSSDSTTSWIGSKTAGTLVHGAYRTIEWRVVGRLATGSVPMATLTLLVLSRFDMTGEASHELITKVLSLRGPGAVRSAPGPAVSALVDTEETVHGIDHAIGDRFVRRC